MVISDIRKLFFPEKLTQQSFETVADAARIHRIAKITKAALFALCSFSLTAAAILSEGGFTALPVTLSLVGVALITGALFYRLYSVGNRYMEGIDDSTRSRLVEEGLEQLLHSPTAPSADAVRKTLRGVNHIAGTPLFNRTEIEKIVDLAKQAAQQQQSLAALLGAKPESVEVFYKCRCEWQEKGRFGAPSHDHRFTLEWSLIPNGTRVSCSCAEVVVTPPEEE